MSKRTAEDAGLDASVQGAKEAKVEVTTTEEVEDFLWTPDWFHYSVEEFMELIPQLFIRPPTSEEGKIWYFFLPLQPNFPLDQFPEEKRKLVADGVIKYQKQIHIAFDEKATTTGLKIWEPSGNIKLKSCSINFAASDLENMVLGVEYNDGRGGMLRGKLLDRLLDLFNEDPVKYFGDNDETLAAMDDMEARKNILARRYAKVRPIDPKTGKPKGTASSMPVLIGRATPNKTDITKMYKPGMKLKGSLNCLDMPDFPIYDKADIERANEEMALAEANGEKGVPPKPLYTQPFNLDPKGKDYEAKLKIAKSQPDPTALLPQWSKMYVSATLLGTMINSAEFGISNRIVQIMRTALSSGTTGGGERVEVCHFMNKCKKPALPPASAPKPVEAPKEEGTAPTAETSE